MGAGMTMLFPVAGSRRRVFEVFCEHSRLLSSFPSRRLRRVVIWSVSAFGALAVRVRQNPEAVSATIDSLGPFRSDAGLGGDDAKVRDQSVLSHGVARPKLRRSASSPPASYGTGVLIPFELAQRASDSQLGSPMLTVGGLGRHRRSHHRT